MSHQTLKGIPWKETGLRRYFLLSLVALLTAIGTQALSEPDTQRPITVSLRDKRVIKGEFGSLRDACSAWNRWQFCRSDTETILFWRDLTFKCRSGFGDWPDSVERVAISDIRSLEFLDARGVCGGTVVRIAFNSGEMKEKSFVSRTESHGGVWFYGSIWNDDLVMYISGEQVEIFLSDVREIRFDPSPPAQVAANRKLVTTWAKMKRNS